MPLLSWQIGQFLGRIRKALGSIGIIVVTFLAGSVYQWTGGDRGKELVRAMALSSCPAANSWSVRKNLDQVG